MTNATNKISAARLTRAVAVALAKLERKHQKDCRRNRYYGVHCPKRFHSAISIRNYAYVELGIAWDSDRGVDPDKVAARASVTDRRVKAALKRLRDDGVVETTRSRELDYRFVSKAEKNRDARRARKQAELDARREAERAKRRLAEEARKATQDAVAAEVTRLIQEAGVSEAEAVRLVQILRGEV